LTDSAHLDLDGRVALYERERVLRPRPEHPGLSNVVGSRPKAKVREASNLSHPQLDTRLSEADIKGC
jgi:hypothetical protein